jgi:phage terminase large subunit-like protein
MYVTATMTEWLTPDEIRKLQLDMRIDDCVGDDWVVFAGLDFSKGDDLNGVSYLAYNTSSGDFFADMDSYMSEEAVDQSPLRELFLKWSSDGWLHVVPGSTFDPSWPVNRIIELSNKGVNFHSFLYDPYNAKIVMNALGQWVFDLGVEPKDVIIPARQNFATYNPVVNEFDYMVKRSSYDGEKQVADPMIHFSMNPLWPWEFGNCVLAESNDGMENRKPVKRQQSSSGKVDNVQMLLSALMGFDLAQSQVE